MKKRPTKKDIHTNVPGIEPWEGRDELLQKEGLIHIQQAVADELRRNLDPEPGASKNLFANFLEIAEFMLRNTCGVGSNFKLAECDISRITHKDVKIYYTCMLVLLTYYFGRLVPNQQEYAWQQVIKMTQEPELCREFSQQLESCVDPESDEFVSLQAGQALWQRAREVLHVQESSKNSTARIYYQTAPGQNLIYVVEQGARDGWLKTE
jgi:hypothetical protein